MSDKHIYSGEALCKRWGDSSTGGRTVTFQLEADGDHPFRGYDGERFAIVVVPIGNDDRPMKKADPVAQRIEPGVSTAKVAGSNPAGATKPKQRWNELRPSARAALLTKDAEFQDYITRFGYQATEADADKFVKTKSNIESKRDLDADVNFPNLRMFNDMEGNFRAWKQARQLGAA